MKNKVNVYNYGKVYQFYLKVEQGNKRVLVFQPVQYSFELEKKCGQEIVIKY